MHSMTGERRCVAIRACAAILALALAACARQSEDIAISGEPASQIFGSLQECPTSWASFIKDLRRSGPPVSTFALPDRITEVPEFHDCQRFLVGNGRSYGPLVAIFAAWELDRLDVRLDSASRTPSLKEGERPSGIAAAGSATVGLAGALIVNLGRRYQVGNLAIERGFSCLYLWRSGRWNAAIVPVPHDDLCLKPILPDTFTTAVVNLKFIANVVPGRRRSDYPPVARWDYDLGTRQQYIGMKCGMAWCEIGSASFNPNPRYPGAFPPDEARVVHIKGWYDEQYLAVDNAGTPIPSQLKGTIIPHPRLDTSIPAHFDSIWAPVAYVALDGGTPQQYAHYKAKLNFEYAPVGNSLLTLNEIAFCNGTKAACGLPLGTSPFCGLSAPEESTVVRWWARVRAVSGSVVYKCITHEDHAGKGVHVPGTARWRWVLKDETTWTRCIEGCCEMDNSM